MTMHVKDSHIKKKLILISLLISCLLSSCSACGTKDEVLPPRDIVVEEVIGSASAGRNGEEWDVYTGLNLVSGDELRVIDDGNLILLFDEDRHLYADHRAFFSILSEGKPGKGVTAVVLQEGRVLAGIDGKPKIKDLFTVMTPNAGVMATKKRTVFSVEIIDEGDSSSTVVNVIEGSAEVRTVLGGAERSQELNEGESGIYAGSTPELTSLLGESADKGRNGGDAFESNVSAQADDEIEDDEVKDNSETADSQSRAYIEGSDTVDIELDPFTEGIIAAYQFMDGISQQADLAATRRAYKTKLEAWLGLVDLQFTAGDRVLGETDDLISVTEPDVLCFGERGFYLGDPEEEMWRFLGFHLDPLIAEEGVSVEGEDDEALAVSTRGFIYSRAGKWALVKIEDGYISEISLGAE